MELAPINKNNIHLSGNRFDPVYSGVNNYGLPRAAHCKLRAQQHAKIKGLCEEKKIPKIKEDYLHELLNCSNLNLETNVSQKEISERLRVSTRTIRRYEKDMLARGLIQSEARGWRQTNAKALLVTKHLKHHKGDNMSPVIKDLNIINTNTYIEKPALVTKHLKHHKGDNMSPVIKDLNIINTNTYIEKPVCRINNLYNKGKIEEHRTEKIPIRSSGKHISSDKLNSGDIIVREEEIISACKARGLGFADIDYVTHHLRTTKGIYDKGAYLARMLRCMVNGTWNRERPSKPHDKPYNPHGVGGSADDSRSLKAKEEGERICNEKHQRDEPPKGLFADMKKMLFS